MGKKKVCEYINTGHTFELHIVTFYWQELYLLLINVACILSYFIQPVEDKWLLSLPILGILSG